MLDVEAASGSILAIAIGIGELAKRLVALFGYAPAGISDAFPNLTGDRDAQLADPDVRHGDRGARLEARGLDIPRNRDDVGFAETEDLSTA